MSADKEFVREPVGLDGSQASITTAQTRYMVAPTPMSIVAIASMCETAADFTTGNEQGQVVISYSTDGSNFTTVYTETAANGNLWAALIPRVHTMTEAQQEVRIPAGAVIRVVFTPSGTTPIFPLLHVAITGVIRQ